MSLPSVSCPLQMENGTGRQIQALVKMQFHRRRGPGGPSHFCRDPQDPTHRLAQSKLHDTPPLPTTRWSATADGRDDAQRGMLCRNFNLAQSRIDRPEKAPRQFVFQRFENQVPPCHFAIETAACLKRCICGHQAHRFAAALEFITGIAYVAAVSILHRLDNRQSLGFYTHNSRHACSIPAAAGIALASFKPVGRTVLQAQCCR